MAIQFEGVLRKMQTELGDQVQYYVVFQDDFIHMNQMLNKALRITWMGHECLNCHEDRPIFRQGFCKNCFLKRPPQATGSCALN